MKYNILTIPPFDRQIKRLAKKYHSIKNEYAMLIDSLEKNPRQGTDLGNNCYKIRISIASKGKGKSGGGRVITHVKVAKTSVYLLTIYDKTEKQDVSNKELADLLKNIPE